MEYTPTLSEYILNALSVMLVAAFCLFLLYGAARGVILEKEMRLRKRRRYS